MNCYFGIDAGTTNIKTTAFDENGNRIAFISEKTPTEKVVYGNEHFYEFNAEKIFAVILSELRKISELTGGYQIRGVAVSSMAESGIPVDRYFRPLSYAIAWYDTRSDRQATELSQKLGDYHIYEITGHFSSYKFGITKIMWFKQNHPELYDRTKYWMTINEYILFRLSGERVCDYSIASRNLCFNIREHRWSDEILETAGVRKDLFCSPVPGGTAIGKITDEVAELTGLPAGIVVSTGGHDHSCAAIGTNSIRPGHALCSMGTSEVTMIALEAPVISEDSFTDQCSFYPHCSGLPYRSLSSMQACGVSLDWAAAILGYRGPEKYARLADAASKSKNHWPAFFPFLRGTMFSPESGGLLLGLRDFHTKQDIAAAVFAGLCSETKFLSDRIARASSRPVTCVHAAGGPSKSDFFMQMKADMMGCDVVLSGESEAACLGAAILAAAGTGDITLDDVSRMAADNQKTYHPHENEAVNFYYSNYEKNRSAALLFR